jgi:hypothetical protein
MGIIKRVQKGEYEIVDIFLEILIQQTQDTMVSLDGKLVSIRDNALTKYGCLVW